MSNVHIFEYLDYYLNLPQPPHYAVMLTGPWGIGKSFGIKRYVKSLQPQKKVAYVSLYGAKSTDDIAVALITALATKSDSKLTRLGSKIGGALATTYAKGGGESVLEFLPEGFCDLLILDDLERAVLSPVEVLGFVNAFVEHEDRKVVIVANEAEITDKRYWSVREKVIGMTFEVAEDVNGALKHFIKSIEDEATREFLESNFSDIRAVFDQSQTKNLRLLDQSLRSWERLFKAIDPTLKEKKAGLSAAFNLFLALSLEIRSSGLRRENLIGRMDQIVLGHLGNRGASDKTTTPLSEAQDRYPRLHLHSTILSDEVLIQVLCDGRIVPPSINASLSEHELFVEPDEEPNWRKVWYGFLREASEFEAAFKRMEQEFAARQFSDPGVVLHVLGLRLFGLEVGELNKSKQEIIVEGRAYIDDLRRAGRLQRYCPSSFERDSAFGLAFATADTATFKELQDYFIGQCEMHYRESWPTIADSLLNDVSDDCEAFYKRVCWSTGEDRPDCADDPILAEIAPEAFVDRVICCSPKAQRTVFEALASRYDGRLESRLSDEATWLMEVDAALQSKIAVLPRIRQYSLKKDFARLLRQALNQARNLASRGDQPDSPEVSNGAPSQT